MSTLRVVSYNIHSGVGRDRRCDPARIAAVLAELDADVIALQEVDSRHAPGREIDQFDYFEKVTGYHAVPGPNIVEHRGRYGNVLLSRHPLLDAVLHRLSVGNREPRGAIEATVETGGRPLVLFVTHLGLGGIERRRQIAGLQRLTRAHRDAALLFMGDFNVLGPHAGLLRRLGHPLGLRCRAPATFPAGRPLLALDRIWTVPEKLRVSVRTHTSALARIASDHLPLVAEIALPAG